MLETSPQTAALARGNDLFRLNFSRHLISITEGVNNSCDRNEIIEKCKAFNKFDPEDDINGEHSIGFFSVNGANYFFRIEYWDKEFEFTADPYNTSIFERILILGKIEEY